MIYSNLIIIHNKLFGNIKFNTEYIYIYIYIYYSIIRLVFGWEFV